MSTSIHKAAGSKALLPVAANLLRTLWRDARLPVALALLATLFVVSVFVVASRTAQFERDRIQSEATDRKTFASQGARNPHSVAHFSRFAFRPVSALAVLDPGIGAFTGSAVWMQAHSQDPPNLRSAEDHVELGRFAELSFAWVLQYLLPLLIVALGFDAVAGDRERGSLSLLRGAGAEIRWLGLGKALALALVAGTVLLAMTTVVATLAVGEPRADVPEFLARIAVWSLAHATYIAVWIAITLAASVYFARARSALIALLALWMLSVLLVPRLAVTVADEIAPAPTPTAFAAAVRADLDQGINGHDSADARGAALKARVLKQYRVDKEEDLPVSFAGLSLQAGEEYGNLVFDRHFARLEARFRQQHNWQRLAAVMSPLLPLQRLSMAATGSDDAHQFDFMRQAEATRRAIVKMLNADMTAHGRGKDFDYLADPSLWSRTPEFAYTRPGIATWFSRYAADAAILLAWLAAAGFVFVSAVRRAEAPQ